MRAAAGVRSRLRLARRQRVELPGCVLYTAIWPPDQRVLAVGLLMGVGFLWYGLEQVSGIPRRKARYEAARRTWEESYICALHGHVFLGSSGQVCRLEDLQKSLKDFGET